MLSGRWSKVEVAPLKAILGRHLTIFDALPHIRRHTSTVADVVMVHRVWSAIRLLRKPHVPFCLSASGYRDTPYIQHPYHGTQRKVNVLICFPNA